MSLMASAGVEGLRRVRIVDAGRPELSWSEGLHVSIPESVLASSGLHRAIDPRGDLSLPADLPTIDAGAAGHLRARAAYTPVGPVSSRLPVSYRSVPGPVRRAMARVVGRWQRARVDRWATFPGWPLDLSVDLLADLASQRPLSMQRTPVLLTHDLDSPEGLRNLVERFLPIEEALGGRSTNFIVPCAWRIDEGLLAETRRRGHELGIHGFDHANRTPFVSAPERRARLRAAQPLAERYSMKVYRAPSLLRTPELLADVAEFYSYDSSIPTSGGLFPVPNNGCATARPFRIGPLVEVPVSLPRDGSLRFLGHGPIEILALWKSCADRVARSRGVVVLLTHCEDHFSGAMPMLQTYRAFLEWLAADDRFEWSRTGDIAASLQHA